MTENIENNNAIQKENINENTYSHCFETNFAILSNRKSFVLPFSIYRSSFDYIKENPLTAKTTRRNHLGMSNSSIFIGAKQNLKAMNIHLSNNFRYNNIAHREITNFKNGKNNSVDRVNGKLSENDAQKNNNTDNKKVEPADILKEINLRWKNNQNIFKNNFSFINKINKKEPIPSPSPSPSPSSTINKKIYIQELLNNIKINTNTNNINNENESNGSNNNEKEYYILIKHNKNNKNENIIHEVISPNSNEDFENSINNFLKKKENKENISNNSESSTVNDNSTLTNGRKKSKFSHQESYHMKKSSSQDINNDQKDEFIPFFIITKKELINLYDIIENKPKENSKPEKIQYSIDNNINYNIISEDIENKPKENIKPETIQYSIDNNINHNIISEDIESKPKENNKPEKIQYSIDNNINYNIISENIENKPKENNKPEKIQYSIDNNINHNIISEDTENKQKENNKPEKIQYSIDNNINYNIISEDNPGKLRSVPKDKKENNENNEIKENKVQKNLEDINFNIFPIKVEKFELICNNHNVASNEIGKGNNNIDVSNIALNQSDYMKQVKGGENEFDYILNKNKEMEDFGQSTPISLLREKSFIYIVSKWVKYSIPQPQSQIYAKYSYKTGHPLFDPITLSMTNFTLWIERIETKNYHSKKAKISINSSSNYVNNIKKNNSKGQNLNNKKK